MLATTTTQNSYIARAKASKRKGAEPSINIVVNRTVLRLLFNQQLNHLRAVVEG